MNEWKDIGLDEYIASIQSLSFDVSRAQPVFKIVSGLNFPDGERFYNPVYLAIGQTAETFQLWEFFKDLRLEIKKPFDPPIERQEYLSLFVGKGPQANELRLVDPVRKGSEIFFSRIKPDEDEIRIKVCRTSLKSLTVEFSRQALPSEKIWGAFGGRTITLEDKQMVFPLEADPASLPEAERILTLGVNESEKNYLLSRIEGLSGLCRVVPLSIRATGYIPEKKSSGRIEEEQNRGSVSDMIDNNARDEFSKLKMERDRLVKQKIELEQKLKQQEKSAAGNRSDAEQELIKKIHRLESELAAERENSNRKLNACMKEIERKMNIIQKLQSEIGKLGSEKNKNDDEHKEEVSGLNKMIQEKAEEIKRIKESSAKKISELINSVSELKQQLIDKVMPASAGRSASGLLPSLNQVELIDYSSEFSLKFLFSGIESKDQYRLEYPHGMDESRKIFITKEEIVIDELKLEQIPRKGHARYLMVSSEEKQVLYALHDYGSSFDNPRKLKFGKLDE